jgi:hypothetical protein
MRPFFRQNAISDCNISTMHALFGIIRIGRHHIRTHFRSYILFIRTDPQGTKRNAFSGLDSSLPDLYCSQWISLLFWSKSTETINIAKPENPIFQDKNILNPCFFRVWLLKVYMYVYTYVYIYNIVCIHWLCGEMTITHEPVNADECPWTKLWWYSNSVHSSIVRWPMLRWPTFLAPSKHGTRNLVRTGAFLF